MVVFGPLVLQKQLPLPILGPLTSCQPLTRIDQLKVPDYLQELGCLAGFAILLGLQQGCFALLTWLCIV